MMNFLKFASAALVLSLSVSVSAHAREEHRNPPPPPSCNPDPKTAPEVDPSLALGAITLLGGTLTVLRSRRKQ